MTGREEHTQAIENKILAEIQNEPDILKNFYYSMQSYSSLTKYRYLTYIKDFCEYFNYKVYDLKSFDITKYLEEKVHYRYEKCVKIENKESIRSLKLSAIKKFYVFLCENELCERNPAEHIHPPKVREEKAITYLTAFDIARVQKNIMKGCGTQREIARREKWKNRDLAIFTLGITTGLRCSAITEINIEDIDFDKRSIKVTEKGNVIRQVFFGDNLTVILHNWLEDRDKLLGNNSCQALFISNKRRRIAQRTVNDIVTKYTQNIDKKISAHKLRSTCAMNLYEKTNDIQVVSQMLGHKNLKTTSRYARATEKKMKNAASILDKLI